MSTDTPVHDLRNDAGMPQDRTRPAPPYPPPDPWAEAIKDTARRYVDDPRRKSPALATIMSAMPGLGQIYVGYYQQGFTNILVVAGPSRCCRTRAGSAWTRSSRSSACSWPSTGCITWWMPAGAPRFYNQALAGLDKTALPEDMRLPSGGGSLAGGVVLVVLGLIIFSNTMFGFSLDWLSQWWPLALVAGGAYLIYSAARDRRRQAEPGA